MRTDTVRRGVTALLPARLRGLLLSLAEIGHERNGDLQLAFAIHQRSLLIDVGANRGQYARFLAPFFDRVMVFEPIQAFGAELRAVLPSNCTVHDCALADASGPAVFHVPTGDDLLDTQTASLIAPSAETAHRRVDVMVRRLDDFALDEASFIKVDVEGAEYEVLKGATATIARCRPAMMIEIEDRHTRGQTKRVFDLLSDLGYDAFVLRSRTDGRRSSGPLRRALRGAAFAGRLAKVDVEPIGSRLAEIYARSQSLNASFGADYVNNFLFLPRRR